MPPSTYSHAKRGGRATHRVRPQAGLREHGTAGNGWTRCSTGRTLTFAPMDSDTASEFDEQTELVAGRQRRASRAHLEDGDETVRGRLVPAAAAIATVEAVLPLPRPTPTEPTRPMPAATARPRILWALVALALGGGILGVAAAMLAR